MAGMLPGVEAARRRRFHHKSNYLIFSELLSPTRRSSFCLYASSHQFHLCSNSPSQRNLMRKQGMCDESRLGAEAREAKKRLDQRLQPPRTSQIKRNFELKTSNSERRLRSSQAGTTRETGTQAAEETAKLRKRGSKRLNWLKLSWKSEEQEECAVCLEQFKAAAPPPPEGVGQLPCGHRFHANCLAPWLETKATCPYCRMEIPS